MVDVYVQPNGVAEAIRYLSGFFPDVVSAEENDDPNHDPASLAILVQDAGGTVRDRAFFDLRLTFEIRSGDRSEAFRVATQVEALIRSWSQTNPRVHFIGEVGSLVYLPVDDHDIPAYRFTSQLAFRGSPLSI